MSGHSKWANIKIKKGKSDAQRGKAFTKLGRELAIATKAGGGNPDANSRLKDVIAKAKAANMPNDNIMRSIKKASGDGDGAVYEEITYEGYGPGGVAVIIDAATDNRNRTAGDIRHYFDKFGGNLGQSGSVSFLFNKKGLILIEKDGKISEDDLMMEALDAGAEDFTSDEDYFEITTDPNDFSKVREALEKKGYEFIEADVSMIPTMMTKLPDAKQIEMMDKLIENLEDMDDVQNVWHNWEQEEEG
jgi:YebC/PmpR family DNA-binding regulatory protein